MPRPFAFWTQTLLLTQALDLSAVPSEALLILMFWAGISQMEPSQVTAREPLQGCPRCRRVPAPLGCRCRSFPWETLSVNQLHAGFDERVFTHLSSVNRHPTRDRSTKKKVYCIQGFSENSINFKTPPELPVVTAENREQTFILGHFKSCKIFATLHLIYYSVITDVKKVTKEKQQAENSKRKHSRSQDNSSKKKWEKQHNPDHCWKNCKFRGSEKREHTSQNKFN